MAPDIHTPRARAEDSHRLFLETLALVQGLGGTPPPVLVRSLARFQEDARDAATLALHRAKEALLEKVAEVHGRARNPGFVFLDWMLSHLESAVSEVRQLEDLNRKLYACSREHGHLWADYQGGPL